MTLLDCSSDEGGQKPPKIQKRKKTLIGLHKSLHLVVREYLSVVRTLEVVFLLVLSTSSSTNYDYIKKKLSNVMKTYFRFTNQFSNECNSKNKLLMFCCNIIVSFPKESQLYYFRL